MEWFHYINNNKNRRVAAGLLVVLMFLAAISPGFIPHISPASNSTELSLTSSTNSYDFIIYPSQPKADLLPYHLKSALESSYTKRASINDTQAIFQNYAIRNHLPKLLGPEPVFSNSFHKNIIFFTLSADIPPPFSNI
jgi:hypothetical protein